MPTPKVSKIISDIKAIKIQGATNVAKACLEGLEVFTREFKSGYPHEFAKEIMRVGEELSEARPNEPLARNAVHYVLLGIDEEDEGHDVDVIRDVVVERSQEVLEMIENAKQKVVNAGIDALAGSKVVLTHCHSSYAVRMLTGLHEVKPDVKVVATETRPLFQGRTTAKELIAAGVDTTMIVDDAAPAFIVQDKHMPIDAVVVGCDEISPEGDIVNKVGTYAIALAAKKDVDKFYVATTLLKLDLRGKFKRPKIEIRDEDEIWKDAPKGLKIINPAFDFVPAELISGFVTEVGVVGTGEVVKRAKEMYPWLAEDTLM